MSALVQARDLAVAYGGPPVLTGVTFAAGPGERLAVLGPNGGGKTTLFRAVLSELPPAGGELAVDGRVATVAQTERSRLDFPVTALDVVVMGTLAGLPWWGRPGRAQRTAARGALERVGLADRADAAFGDLSGGQRQRVLIARALVAEPRLLLLDEPYTGLDAPGAERLDGLLAELAAEGRAVLMATHDLDHARAADLVLCLNRRQVAFGPPAEALSRDVLERTYGGEIVELPGDAGRAILPAHHHGHAH